MIRTRKPIAGGRRGGLGTIQGRPSLARRYEQLITSIAPAGLIFNGPLNETSGTTADDKSAQNNDATYRNASMLNQSTSLTGEPCPLWTPASNDYLSMPASFFADFNLDEYCINLWFKVRAAGVWTDATARQLFEMNLNGSNRTFARRTTTNNQLSFTHIAAGTSEVVFHTISDTGWNMLTAKASRSTGASGEFKAFINGSQTGSTQTTLGTAAGAIVGGFIGAVNATPAGVVFDGYIAAVSIWSGAGNLPSDSEVAAIYDFLA